MDEQNEVMQETLNPVEEVSDSTTETTETTEEESVEELKTKLQKQEELVKNYKIRAEKAEKKAKEKPEPTPIKEPELSTLDVIALTKTNVNEDDIPDVIEYAKFKKITVKEALKTNVVKTMLADKEEQRKVAEATNVNATKRSSSKPSDESLLNKASKGDLPDDVEALVEARLKAKKAR